MVGVLIDSALKTFCKNACDLKISEFFYYEEFDESYLCKNNSFHNLYNTKNLLFFRAAY